ncbi:MAG TPA: UDP-N-acetylmuramate dehydrogenase [Candidatus Binatia bacterium]|nr:UDP-N-acetylmuramate dehydrogenase [Candidatus Binatia bacterium]
MTATLRQNEPGAPPRVGATLRAALAERFGARARFEEPLSRHTSLRIGGPADVWIDVESVAELSDLLAIAHGTSAGSPVFVLGSGTNVLVSDRGVRGIVVHLGGGFRFVEWAVTSEQATVRAGAAVPFKKLVYDAVKRGFSGLEFGEGIPGSLGGGLTMNAGAFGGEIGLVVERLEGVHPGGRVEELPRARLAFEYRRLELPPGWIITSVRLRLERGDPVEIEARVAAARDKRKKSQPLGLPNAGSIFKNPPGSFAGRLLEEAGLKGLERGGARVSERHANFIVNQGGATAQDVRSLMEEMRERVYARSGIPLETEVKLVGEW